MIARRVGTALLIAAVAVVLAFLLIVTVFALFAPTAAAHEGCHSKNPAYCESPSPSPSASESESPSPSSSESPAPSTSASPTASPSETSSPSPSPTETVTPSPTASPTPTQSQICGVTCVVPPKYPSPGVTSPPEDELPHTGVSDAVVFLGLFLLILGGLAVMAGRRP